MRKKVTIAVMVAALLGTSVPSSAAVQSLASSPSPAAVSQKQDGSVDISSLTKARETTVSDVNNVVAAARADSTAVLGKPLAGKALSEVVQRSKSQAETTDLLKLRSEWSIDFSTSRAWRSGGTLRFSAALRGDDLVAPSNVVFTFDESDALVSVDQMHFISIGEADRGVLQVLRNGETTKQLLVSSNKNVPPENLPSGKSLDEALSIQGLKRFHWSRFNSCLSNSGASAWAAAALAALCAPACLGTAGLGCYLCLVGVNYIAAGTITYCFGVAWY